MKDKGKWGRSTGGVFPLSVMVTELNDVACLPCDFFQVISTTLRFLLLCLSAVPRELTALWLCPYMHQCQAGFTSNHKTLPSPLTPCHFPSAVSWGDGSPCTALLREAGNVSLHKPRRMALILVFAQPPAQRGGSCGEAPRHSQCCPMYHPGCRTALPRSGPALPGNWTSEGSIFQSMCHFTCPHPSLSLCFAGKAMSPNFPWISSKGNWYFPEFLFFLSKSFFKQF